jgi:hypothetical protein
MRAVVRFVAVAGVVAAAIPAADLGCSVKMA